MSAAEVVVSTAPLRADLAGGTLDLWPLGALHPGSCTVNVALSGVAECRVFPSPDGRWVFRSADYGSALVHDSLDGAERDQRCALLARLCRHFAGGSPPFVVETRSDSPPGSGLGGSSALAVAAAAAICGAAGRERPDDERLVATVRDLEAALLGKPTGIQDYWPAVRGGVLTLRHRPGGAVVDRPMADPSPLSGRILLVHTGVSHFSAENNWEIYRRRLEGDLRIARLFDEIRDAALEVDGALRMGDWDAFARGVDREWTARRQLAPGIVTPEMQEIEDRLRSAGAVAAKTCGAGGGGVMLFVVEAERSAEVRREAAALTTGRLLGLEPSAAGLGLGRGVAVRA